MTLDAMTDQQVLSLVNDLRSPWIRQLLEKSGRKSKLIRPTLLKAMAKRKDPFAELPPKNPEWYQPKGEK